MSVCGYSGYKRFWVHALCPEHNYSDKVVSWVVAAVEEGKGCAAATGSSQESKLGDKINSSSSSSSSLSSSSCS